MSVTTRALALGAAVFSVMLGGGAALAQSTDDTVSVTAAATPHGAVTRVTKVAYGDLDLTTARGQRRLERRIDDAADAVCADVGRWDRFAWQDQRNCLDGAVTTAMAQVRAGSAAGVN